MLFLNKNQIKNIDSLKSLKYLQFLDLSDNHIEDLEPLRYLEELEALSIINNCVKDLTPITKLPHLFALLAQGNQIASIKGVQPLPIISVENQYLQWELESINHDEAIIELNGKLVDINGNVPLIIAVTPKDIRYDNIKESISFEDNIRFISIFFHNQNQSVPFSGELYISLIKS